MLIHAISTGKESVDSFVQKASAIYDIVDFIHIRERNWSVAQYREAIQDLQKIDKHLQKIVINDRVDVAYIHNVRNVHLPSHSVQPEEMNRYFPTLSYGVSVHSIDEAIEKERKGATYLMFGHIFPTNSKPGLTPRGLEKLKNVVKAVSIPVIAIGGITPEKIFEIRRCGAKGVAILSGIFSHSNPEKAALQYHEFTKY